MEASDPPEERTRSEAQSRNAAPKRRCGSVFERTRPATIRSARPAGSGAKIATTSRETQPVAAPFFPSVAGPSAAILSTLRYGSFESISFSREPVNGSIRLKTN